MTREELITLVELPVEAISQGVCVRCQREARFHCHTLEGEEQYFLSGHCEECYDEIMGGEI